MDPEKRRAGERAIEAAELFAEIDTSIRRTDRLFLVVGVICVIAFGYLAGSSDDGWRYLWAFLTGLSGVLLGITLADRREWTRRSGKLRAEADRIREEIRDPFETRSEP